QNQTPAVVLFDHLAGRWVISGRAYPAFPGTSFYQCFAVSKTGDPIGGGYNLYGLQVDPANINRLGENPRLGLWPAAIHLRANEYVDAQPFVGVRVWGPHRIAMNTGGPANAACFTINAADLGYQRSLVPATLTPGDPPPAGRSAFVVNLNN